MNADPTGSSSAATESARPEKPLSQKVEDSLEGFFRFVYRYVATIGQLTFKPSRIGAALHTDNPSIHTPVRPFTFFSIAYFLIAVLVSQTGFNIVNSIWLTEEFGRELLARIETGISLTEIAATAIPGFAVVFGLSSLAGRFLLGRERVSDFLALSCYGFGTQCALLFAAVALMFVDLLDGSELGPGIALLMDTRVGGVIVGVVWYSLLIASLLAPLVLVSLGVRGLCTQDQRRVGFWRYGAVLVFCSVVPPLYVMGGTILPGITSGLSQAPSVEYQMLTEVEALAHPDQDVIETRFRLALTNGTNEALIFGSDDLYLTLETTPYAEEEGHWSADEIELTDLSSLGTPLIVVEAGRVALVEILGRFEGLPPFVPQRLEEGMSTYHGDYLMNLEIYGFGPSVVMEQRTTSLELGGSDDFFERLEQTER